MEKYDENARKLQNELSFCPWKKFETQIENGIRFSRKDITRLNLDSRKFKVPFDELIRSLNKMID